MMSYLSRSQTAFHRCDKVTDMSRTKVVTFLILLCLIDMVIPVPILGLVLVHVVFTRPAWFNEVVERVYRG
jgi:hypothetical protein